MKRFLIFAGEYSTDPREGGANDLRAQAETIEIAREWWRYNRRSIYDGWMNVLDTKTGKIVLCLTHKKPDTNAHTTE